MSPSTPPRDDQAVASALGLTVPVYRHLREALAQGEDPSWLRLADPELAGLFPNAFGFEVLLDRMHLAESLERRRANLLRQLQGKELPAIEQAVLEAQDEGELEDLSLALEPSPPPEGWEAPEREEIAAFFDRLRGDVGIARDLRRLFREKGLVKVTAVEGAEQAALRPFQQYLDSEESALLLPPQKYLALRRGERAHALRLEFRIPLADLRQMFERSVQGYPPQERDAWLKHWIAFVERERLPRFVQEARSRLKRAAENLALQQAWGHLENALDRGRHEGPVLGACVVRGGKLMLALLGPDGELQRSTAFPAKARDLGERLLKFLGEERPRLAAFQADGATRAVSPAVLEALRSAAEGKVRSSLIPVAVVKTMLREVARRPGETHLTHDERQALLLARLAWSPREAAFHTPHIVRAWIPFRGEINHRRLEHFEITFLRTLLAERGVELNEGGRDLLKLVPGIDADGVEYERSTAPFRSLEDFQARMGLEPRHWRAAGCFLRVRGGDEPLDARSLHPFYYTVLRRALEAASSTEGGEGASLRLQDLLKEPARVQELSWEPILEERGWKPAVVELIRSGLTRGRRPRRGPRAPQGIRLEALEPGATLRGTVTSIQPYGVFVDVGARREGLVHVSEVSDTFVRDPAEVLQVGQEVTVRVLAVDVEKQKLRLSMRSGEREERPEGEGRKRRAGEGRRQGGGRGGPRDGRRGGRRGRRDRDDFEPGPDPRAVTEEIDPTNPFYRFFKEHGLPGQPREDEAAAPAGGGEAAEETGPEGAAS